MSRITPFRDEIALFTKGLSETERPALIRETFELAVADAQKTNQAALGYMPRYEVITDGQRGRPPEQMRVGGVATARFDIEGDIIGFGIDLLRRLAPRRSGKFARHFIVFVDGRVLPPPYIPPPDYNVVQWTNLLPYARKLEGGPGFDAISSQRPNGYMQALALPQIKRVYGNLWNVFYDRASYPMAARFNQAARRIDTSQGRKTTRRRTQNDILRATRQFPTIEARRL